MKRESNISNLNWRQKTKKEKKQLKKAKRNWRLTQLSLPLHERSQLFKTL